MTAKINPIRAALALGQSIWYDNIQRAMLSSGELQRMIRDDGLRGLTSNPTIFEKAITGSHDYDQALLDELRRQPGQNSESLFYALAIEDIRAPTAGRQAPGQTPTTGHTARKSPRR